MELRRTLTAIFAWLTLAGGACVLNALTGLVLYLILPKIWPGASETIFWKVFALACALLGPCWIIALLNWFKGGKAAPQG